MSFGVVLEVEATESLAIVSSASSEDDVDEDSDDDDEEVSCREVAENN